MAIQHRISVERMLSSVSAVSGVSCMCRRGAGDDCGGGRCWVCEVGLPRAAGNCGIMVCLPSAGWAAVSTHAGLHQEGCA